MRDIDSMVRTRRVICIKKYLEDCNSPCKAFLNETLIPVGGKLILHCNSILLNWVFTYQVSMFGCVVRSKCKKTPCSLHEVAIEVIILE